MLLAICSINTGHKVPLWINGRIWDPGHRRPALNDLMKDDYT
jgi:hypothetical protein